MELIECLNRGDIRDPCMGPVEFHQRPRDGKSFPRCQHHADKWYELQDEIERRYPYHQPADFDPGYAGERWDDDY